MKRKKKPRRQARPLKTTLADLTGPVRFPTKQPAIPLPQRPQMPSPPRSAREVLTLLTAATALVLAARPDAEVELLPGTPTTVLVTSAGKARAAFVLPVPHAEACHILGRPITPGPDPELDLLWAEEAATWKVGHAS